MTYKYGYITKPKNNVLLGLSTILAMLGFMVLATSRAQSLPVSGPGEVLVGVDASVWDSTMPITPTQFPVRGSGQVNGEFTTAERNGVVVGLRGQQRFFGPLAATASENGKVGMYEALTGETFSATGTRGAWWNFDWHVDLRGGKGVQANRTLADYDLMLESNLGYPSPLGWETGVPQTVRLYQGSFNAVFGNPTFDVNAEGTYDIRLVLKPKTFKGPELAVMIQVNVTNP